jgi:hypothetical protein
VPDPPSWTVVRAGWCWILGPAALAGKAKTSRAVIVARIAAIAFALIGPGGLFLRFAAGIGAEGRVGAGSRQRHDAEARQVQPQVAGPADLG